MAWVVAQLEHFIEITAPKSTSTPGNFRSTRVASVPERDVIKEQDVIEAILNRFYPGWFEDNPTDRNFRWQQHRVAAQRCLAQIRRAEEIQSNLGDIGPRLRAAGLHPWVWEAAARLWDDGHRRMAIQSAATAIDTYTQAKLARNDLAGSDLMANAFNEKPASPIDPRLRFPEFQQGTPNWTSAHQGAKFFGMGCMMRIRNLATHNQQEPSEQVALEELAALSVLARWVDEATVMR